MSDLILLVVSSARPGELYVNWSDHSVAIFEAILNPNWAPVSVQFYCFCHGCRSRQKKQWKETGTKFGFKFQIVFKDGRRITFSYSSSLYRVHCPDHSIRVSRVFGFTKTEFNTTEQIHASFNLVRSKDHVNWR